MFLCIARGVVQACFCDNMRIQRNLFAKIEVTAVHANGHGRLTMSQWTQAFPQGKCGFGLRSVGR